MLSQLLHSLLCLLILQLFEHAVPADMSYYFFTPRFKAESVVSKIIQFYQRLALLIL